MKKLLIMSALAAFVSVAGMADANAWTSSGTVTGPRGNSVSRSAAGGCIGGVCAGKSTVTGPRGNSVTRAGVTTRGTYRHGRYYAPRPVVYVPAPVVYPRPYYYARYYYGARYVAPAYYRVAYYRPY